MRAETNQIVAMLDNGVLGGKVFAGLAPDDYPAPYVCVMPARNEDEQARLTGGHATEVITLTVLSVGQSADQSAWLDEQVDRVLRPSGMGIRPSVPGRHCGRIYRRVTDTRPSSLAIRIWETATVYQFTSTPIP